MAFLWTQIGSDIDGEAVDDNSGYSVSLSSDGTRVAISAPFNDGNGSSSGHVRVYEYSNSSWTQLGGDIDGEAVDDESGYSVSLSSDGSKVAIGARYNDGAGLNSGHVRVYEYSSNNSSWTQLGGDIDGEAAGDQSGWSVSLSSHGTRVAIGANYNKQGSLSIRGHVRVYEYSSNSWNQIGGDIDAEAGGDQSGYSVSLSSDGSKVAIGAQSNDGNGSDSGHVRVYEYSNSSWTQLGGDIDGEAAGDYSGWSVSLSSDGSKVAIGAIYNDGAGSNSGHVRVYEYSSNNSSWTKIGSDIYGEAVDDYSGYSVSLSSDGTRVAIGARSNDGAGSNSGHVRVYEYSNSSWTKIGSDIYGEAADDYSGWSVSLSSDGTRVAIGAPRNDGAGPSSGHVRVFELEQRITNFPICFPAGTPVLTDQGIVPIEKICPGIHTIYKKKIVAVTQTITNENTLVCIEKDALQKRIPNKKTIISRCHSIFYNGKMVQARELVKKVENVRIVKYNKELLYNILMEKHEKMIVNNMIVETLDPKNIIAKLYSNNYGEIEKRNIIVEVNNCIKRSDFTPFRISNAHFI